MLIHMKRVTRSILSILLILTIVSTLNGNFCFATSTNETTESPEPTNASENTKNTDTSEVKNSDTSLGITAEAAVILEGSTGAILYEKNKDKELVPASITKIMTLLLIFETLESGKIKLEDTVSVSDFAASMGGSQVFLEVNETQTVDTMIKCISIASANDAAVAMAEYIAGSETAFVERMNEKAAELGMEHTQFMNCNGLDDTIESGHYTSAYDVALMSRELITKYPQISNYSTVWMDTITHTNSKGESSEFGLTNTNKLIRTYTGITGLKTGSTSKAKYCLSATANRNNMDLIAVIMAAPDHKTRFSEAASLLDYGFANCELYKDEHDDFVCTPIEVKGSLTTTVSYKPESAFSYTFVNNEDTSQIQSEIKLAESLTAPIATGDVVGSIEYSYGGAPLGSVKLLADNDALKAGFSDYFGALFKGFVSLSY